MRATRYLLPTLRDAPGDAVAESHKLLVRAGMVKQVGAGMWTWLPLGWRVQSACRRSSARRWIASAGRRC